MSPLERKKQHLTLHSYSLFYLDIDVPHLSPLYLIRHDGVFPPLDSDTDSLKGQKKEQLLFNLEKK